MTASWQPILASRVFANAHSVDGELSVLQHLLDIYVTRNHSLWKVNEVQAFLLRSTQHALATPTLVSANPQVLELPTCVDKYLRAVTAGEKTNKETSSCTCNTDTLITFCRVWDC